jgi:hypothetical protein
MFNHLKGDNLNTETNYVEIYFGKKKSNKEFKTNLESKQITVFNDFKSKYKTNKYSQKKYYHKNLIHYVNININNSSNSITYEHKNLDTNIIQNSNIDLITFCNKRLNNAVFPCLYSYMLTELLEIEEIEISNTIKILLFNNSIKFELTKDKNWKDTINLFKKTIENLLFMFNP